MSTVNVNRVVDSSGGVLAPISSVMRNRIINGAMVIDQRNAGAAVTALDSVPVDRFRFEGNQTSKLTWQQNAGSVTPPVGFTNYLGATSSSAYSITSTDFFVISQRIEGYNMADLGWGTASAKTVTLSFQVYSSLTGTFGGVIANNAANYNYPFTYSIPTANTWTTISVTIAGATSGTWLTTNGSGITVRFGLGVGATYSATAGAWTTTASILGATGATSVVGTSGATFYITGVQLEVGTQATSFEYRQYQQELALCQRYYWKATGVSAGYGVDGLYAASGGNGLVISWGHPITMRAAPTATADYNDLTNCTVSLNTTATGFRVILTSTSSGRTGAGFTATGFVSMSAEL